MITKEQRKMLAANLLYLVAMDTTQAAYRQFEMGGRDRDSGGALLVNGQFEATIDSGSISNSIAASTFYTENDIAFFEATRAGLTAVPEPGSMVLVAACGGLFVWRRLRRKGAKLRRLQYQQRLRRKVV